MTKSVWHLLHVLYTKVICYIYINNINNMRTQKLHLAQKCAIKINKLIKIVDYLLTTYFWAPCHFWVRMLGAFICLLPCHKTVNIILFSDKTFFLHNCLKSIIVMEILMALKTFSCPNFGHFCPKTLQFWCHYCQCLKK